MPAIGKYKKIVTNNSDLNRVQDQVAAALDAISVCPLLGGTWIRNIQLTNQKVNTISHGLGVNYRGFIPTNPTNTQGFIQIWISAIQNNSPDKIILLEVLDSMTADIYFF